MKLQDITQDQLTEFFLNDPPLCYLGVDDDTLAALYHDKKYPISELSFFQGVWENDVLVAVMRFEKFSELAVSCHTFLGTPFQGKGIGQKVKEVVYEYLRDTTPFTKAITMAPAPCIHVMKTVEACGFVKEGVLTNCVTWRTKVVDLHIYALEIKRGT